MLAEEVQSAVWGLSPAEHPGGLGGAVLAGASSVSVVLTGVDFPRDTPFQGTKSFTACFVVLHEKLAI